MFEFQIKEAEAEWLARIRADLRRIEFLRGELWELQQWQDAPERTREEFHWAKHQINSIRQELVDLGEDADDL